MKLKKIAAVWVALVALVLVGCKNDADTEVVLANIHGTWNGQYPGESYEIAPTHFKSNGSYEGSTTYIHYTSKTSGYIYFKYTKSALPDYSDYTTTAPDVGKWYCVMFKNLKADSVFIAGAYKLGGKTSAETLEEAISEFTVENGYFSMYSECVRK